MRLVTLVLVGLFTSSPAYAVTVLIRSASVDCGSPVTLPLSISNQNASLRDLTFRIDIDPAQVRFNGFAIDPRGVLPDYRSEAKVLSDRIVEVSLTQAAQPGNTNGLFGTVSLSLVSTNPGKITVGIRDVTYATGFQGLPQAGQGVPGIITASCPIDPQDRPEVIRLSPFAGSTGGGGFVDGEGGNARFVTPTGIAQIGSTLFVTDSEAHTIRRISIDGAVTTWAGAAGASGRNDGFRGAARFNQPRGLAAMPDGSLLVADSGNRLIRRITPDGTVSVWAGVGTPGYRDSTRLTSNFESPEVLAVEPSGAVLVADAGSCTIRRIVGDAVTTVAGRPYVCGGLNGAVSVATFDGMSGIVSHPSLGIFVADHRNHVVRRITADSTVLNFVGVEGEPGSTDGLNALVRLTRPRGLALAPDQSVLIATANGIRKVTGGATQTIVGGTSTGWADGNGTAARMNEVSGIVSAADAIHATELGNTLVRRISSTFDVSTVAGSASQRGRRDDLGQAARFDRPWQVAVDASGNTYVADRGNRTIRRISPDGNVTLWAGQPGVAGGTDGPRLEATFQDPAGCVIDAGGNIWISEPSAHVIRVIRPGGTVETAGGLRGTPGLVDGTAAASRFNLPMQLGVDPSGRVWVADSGNHAIRRIELNGTIATVAGSRGGVAGSEGGAALSARFDTPTSVAVAADGGVFIADKGNHAVRELRNGVVSSVLGITEAEGQADGPPPGGRLFEPEGLSVMPDGSLVVAESTGRIRRIVGSSISTIAGRFRIRGNQTGLGSEALFSAPVSVAHIGHGSFVVSDSANHAIVRAARCADGTLCLGEARFAVSLQATDPRTGARGEGLPLAENDLFGFFSIPDLTGNPANPEVFVKVLDGRGVNGKFWVFYGGLTDFEFDLDVRDRLTGAVKSYRKPGFEFCGGADTGAFDKGTAALTDRAVTARSTTPVEETEACDAPSLCLRSGRFLVALSAKDPRTGAEAAGVPIPRTADFGYFSLPGLTGNAANPEVFVKVLDGRGVNGRFWVFYGGLTDFEFTLEVTDGETGAKRSYVKPGLDFCGGADTSAF